MRIRCLNVYRFPVATLCALLALVCQTSPARALEPDQLLLIVNSKAPAGRELAEFYAKQRGVPAGRILELDLAFPAEQMSRASYDADVVPKVREFIVKNGLEKQIACAVTFYGVPLRVAGRTSTPEDEKEAAAVEAETAEVEAEITRDVETLEKLAVLHQPGFKPAPATAAAPAPRGGADPGESPHAAAAQALVKRADAAVSAALGGISRITDVKAKQEAVARLRGLIERLAGRHEAVLKLGDPKIAKVLGEPVSRKDVEEARKQLGALQRLLASEGRRPGATPASVRDLTRKLVRGNMGSFKLLMLLVQQRAAFETRESEAAFDSELALIRLDGYPLSRWQLNPMHHRVAGRVRVPVMMVTRLDGPTAAVVRRMIETSVKVEAEGLSGNVVLDARGRAPSDAYGRYDQTIRMLGQIVRNETQLPLTLDDKEALFQPGAAKDVAVYCGWYSLRNYVPAFTFKPGAVGFHIASGELVSLRGKDERGWVRNLLNDGVVATVGPVAEPYLHAFPNADEFFPLLMTGRLTLAEAYWRTNPLTSWMNTCIGDPLYAPFKAKPALKLEDLPEGLRAGVEGSSKGGAPAPEAAPAK